MEKEKTIPGLLASANGGRSRYETFVTESQTAGDAENGVTVAGYTSPQALPFKREREGDAAEPDVPALHLLRWTARFETVGDGPPAAPVDGTCEGRVQRRLARASGLLSFR